MDRPSRLFHFIESAILAAPRHKLRMASRKKLGAAVTALHQVRETRIKLAKYNMPDVLQLYDASQFCIAYAADLTVLTRDMACARDWWEERLYARLLALTMLECVEDLPVILGKKFRNSLAAVVPNNEYKQRLSKISSNLSAFKNRHDRELRHIRQIAAAHRDHDPNVLISLIEQLDMKKLMKMAGALHDLQTEFARAMTKVFLNINAVKEVLKAFSSKAQKQA